MPAGQGATFLPSWQLKSLSNRHQLISCLVSPSRDRCHNSFAKRRSSSKSPPWRCGAGLSSELSRQSSLSHVLRNREASWEGPPWRCGAGLTSDFSRRSTSPHFSTLSVRIMRELPEPQALLQGRLLNEAVLNEAAWNKALLEQEAWNSRERGARHPQRWRPASAPRLLQGGSPSPPPSASPPRGPRAE